MAIGVADTPPVLDIFRRCSDSSEQLKATLKNSQTISLALRKGLVMRRSLRSLKRGTRSEQNSNRQKTLGQSVFHRRLVCEALEDRRLLNGMTLITHGYELTGNLENTKWLDGMVKAAAERIALVYTGSTDNSSQVAQFEMTITCDLVTKAFDITWTYGGNFVGDPDPKSFNLMDSLDGEAVILLNWSQAASLIDGVSTATIASLTKDYLLGPTLGNLGKQLAGSSIHLIGHSRGASLIGALAEDLGEAGIWVDQTTFLDAHPLTSPLDWGNDEMVVPDNVAYADSYYRDQTSTEPNGEHVTGALNTHLNGSHFNDGDIGYGDLFDTHSDVHLWYHGTINTQDSFSDGEETVPDPNVANSPGTDYWYSENAYISSDLDSTDREDIGFNLSRIAGNTHDAPTDFVNKGNWPNVGYLELQQTTVCRGDSISIEYYYDVPKLDTATLSFYLDNNQNPYDGNTALLGSSPSVTSSVVSKGDFTAYVPAGTVPGVYYICAKINDGTHTRYAYASNALAVDHAPVLSHCSVTPTAGTTTTDFTYRVTYSDADGDEPNVDASVYIDGVRHPMSLESGQTANGTYSYTTTLSTGTNHNYYFRFQNSRDPVVTSSIYSGPDVGSVTTSSVVTIRAAGYGGVPFTDDIEIRYSVNGGTTVTVPGSQFATPQGFAILVTASATIHLQACTTSANHSFGEWEIRQNGQIVPGGAGTNPSIDINLVAGNVGVSSFWNYTPQSYDLGGTVSQYHLPIEGVTVSLVGSGAVQTAVTGADGRYHFDQIAGGVPYTISIGDGSDTSDPVSYSISNLTQSCNIYDFSILSSDHDLPSADLSTPTNGGSIAQSTLNAIDRYIDVAFSDDGGSGLDVSTITDSGQEFNLTGAAASGVAVNGAATLVPGTTSTYRYTFTGSFGVGDVGVNYIAGSFADNAENTNAAKTEGFSVLGPFTDLGSLGLTAVVYGSVAWGDYDNDGRLDVVLAGDSYFGGGTSGYVTKLYRNIGNSQFQEVSVELIGVSGGSVAWGDYDNDGRLDILLAGRAADGNPVARVYHNDENDQFHDISAGLTGVQGSSVAWGDYDNDGRPDILLSGEASGGFVITKLYHNDGNGQFHEVAAQLTGVDLGSVAWGDYDNDGRLDVLLSGQGVTKVFRNDGNGQFHDISAGLIGLFESSAQWGDYNNDGRLDIVVNGRDSNANALTKIYRNDGNGQFFDINAGLIGGVQGVAAWGDYDNDGRLDILISGGAANPEPRVYHNDGNDEFHDISAGLVGLSSSTGTWGDFDNDGSIDLLLSGYKPSGLPLKLNIYHNNGQVPTSAPLAPSNLTVSTLLSASATLSWIASTDGQTPTAGLTYNLRVGTKPGNCDVVNAMADATGLRGLVQRGMIQGTSWTLNNLTPGQAYYWSVQAVDSAFAGSSFATEETFSIDANQPPTDITLSTVSVAENQPLGTVVGVVSGTDSDAGQSATLTFSLVSGYGDNSLFTIDPATKQLKTATAFDYEAKSSYSIKIRATDTGTPALTYDKVFAVNVTDVNEQPTNLLLSSASVSENQPVGTVVGVVSGTDPDAGQSATLTFSLVSGYGDNSLFTIDPATKQLKTAAVFDYEAKSSYGIKIRATDTGTPALTYDKVFAVNVININERPLVEIVTQSGTVSGDVSFTYWLTDAESDPCSIAVEYSTDGGANWHTATSVSDEGDGITGLASSPSGTSHTFMWASGSDIVNASNSSVEVRITPTDTATGTAGTTTTFTVNNLSPYRVQSITDPNTGNIEYQMFYNDFQFGTVVQTPAGAVGFRGHPDQNDMNGWGTTVYENVYISGSGIGATGGAVNSATAGTSGIQVSAGGDVPSSAGSAGSWNWTSIITYDPVQQTAALTGSTTVTLAAALSGDMNIGRDDSNYLYDYSLNGGGVGPTGDMKSVTFTYGPDSSVRTGHWTPLPGSEGTSPQDASNDLTTIVWGQINKSDPNLATIAKPTVERQIVSTDPTTKLIVACNWDSTQVGYQYDNIGVEQIVRPQNTTATTFTFQNTEKWTLPDTTSPTITAASQTTHINMPVLTGTVNNSSSSEPIVAVQIVIPGVTATPLTATVNDTTWSVVIPTALPIGTYDVQATATDAGGNTAFATATLTIENQIIWQDTIGLFAPTSSKFFLRNTNDVGFANQTFVYGPANTGWKPIAGDWNVDGMGTIGLFNPTTSKFYLSNTNDAGVADLTFNYGPANTGWLPITGDWDGNGSDTIGLYNPTTSVFYLRNTNDAGFADLTFNYGPANAGWLPIVGDWNHQGKDTIGLYNPITSKFYLHNTNSGGIADLTFVYGPANTGWKPIVGDWNADGTDTIGLFTPATSKFYQRNTNDSGFADLTFNYGPANLGWQPIVCDWNGSASALRVAGGAIATDTAPLSQSALQPIVSEAIARWAATGLQASSLATLNKANYAIADLPGSYLGLADANTVSIDRDAAGHGWFVDPTPADDLEFNTNDSPAVDRVDLLTTVMHEMGHLLGHDHTDDGLMSAILPLGVRCAAVDEVFATL